MYFRIYFVESEYMLVLYEMITFNAPSLKVTFNLRQNIAQDVYCILIFTWNF